MSVAVSALLAASGAAEIAHPGGTLLDHLLRTGDTLASWGAKPWVADAGRLHAAHGTDGFPHPVPGLDAAAIRAAAGVEVERLVELYGCCDRRRSHPTLTTDAPTVVDRHTGVARRLTPEQTRAFAELTAANELDVLVHNPAFAAEFATALARRFERWAPLLSPAAVAAWAANSPR